MQDHKKTSKEVKISGMVSGTGFITFVLRMRKKNIRIFLLGLLMMLTADAGAQKGKSPAARDSLRLLRDTMNVYTLNRTVWLWDGLFRRNPVDTGLNQAHVYNPVTQKFNSILSDNLGRPFQPAIFEPDTLRGFSTGRAGSSFYFYRGGEQPYYRTKRAWSEIGYVLGSSGQKKENRVGEQAIHLLHTQPISKTAQVGFDFRRFTAVGFYQRQWAAHSNIRLFGSHLGKKENYGITADFIFNNSTVQENGGLSKDVNFRESLITNIIQGDTFTTRLNRKIGYPVNLSLAENRHQTLEIFAKQFFRVGVKTISADSTNPGIKLPLFQIDHTLRIFTDRQIFLDSSANGFFDNYFFDSTGTRYRIYHRELQNQLEFSFYPFRKKGFANKLSAGISASLFDFRQDTLLYRGFNVSLFSRLTLFLDSLRYFRAFAEYTPGGYNTNDLYIQASVHAGFASAKKGTWMVLEPGVLFTLREPGFVWQRMISNHFDWTNSFRKVRTLGIYTDLYFPTRQIKTGAKFFLTGNLLYLDKDAQAAQVNGETSVFQAWVSHDLAFSRKRFHWVNFAMYQTADNEFVRVAPFYLRSSFYYENKLFKKALLLQAGFDIYYGLGYTGYGYNPALMGFFLQEGQSRVAGYPYLDVYVSAKIKRFRIFLHAGHLNQGFPKPAYFTTPGYAMQDRSFRLGIRWGLFN
jgi:hypothetical protein